MGFISKVECKKVVATNADFIQQAAENLINQFSGEISDVAMHFKKNIALLERYDLTSNSAYQSLLDEIEKKLAVKIKVWRKLTFK